MLFATKPLRPTLSGLDRALLPGNVVVLGGPASSGRTALAYRVVLDALGGDGDVLLFSFRLDAAEARRRLVAAAARTSLAATVALDARSPERMRVEAARGLVAKLRIVDAVSALDDKTLRAVDEQRELLWEQGREHEEDPFGIQASMFYARWVAETIAGLPEPRLVVVDALQEICHSDASEWGETMIRLPYELKRAARRYQVPVLAVSNVSGRGRRYPSAIDLAGGNGSIESAADAVYFVEIEECGGTRDRALHLELVQPISERVELRLITSSLRVEPAR